MPSEAIPANFLLDENGVIVGHNLRGDALAAKVKEILESQIITGNSIIVESRWGMLSSGFYIYNKYQVMSRKEDFFSHINEGYACKGDYHYPWRRNA